VNAYEKSFELVKKNYETALEIPASSHGDQMNAYWLTTYRANEYQLDDFAQKMMQEAFAFAEGLSERQRRIQQVASPLNQLLLLREKMEVK
jgi:hypothetical protein